MYPEGQQCTKTDTTPPMVNKVIINTINTCEVIYISIYMSIHVNISQYIHEH